MLLPKRHLHIMSGASGAGKTTLLLQAIKAWENKEPFPIEFDATSIGYLVADRGDQDVKDMCHQLDIKNVEVYGFVGDKTFPLAYLKNAEVMLQKCLEKFTRNHDLIILDPLLPFMAEKNTKDLTATMLSLIPLSRMADANNITILGSHHSSKSRSDFAFKRAQDRASGSAGMQGYSCVQIALVEGVEMDKMYHMLEITPHREARQQFWLDRGEGGWFKVVEDRLAGLGKLGRAFEAVDKLPTKDLLELTRKMGLSKATVHRQLTKLLDEGQLIKSDRGIYEIPERTGDGGT